MSPRFRRTLSRIAAFGLVCVCLVQAFGTGLETVRAYRQTPVAAAAIEIGSKAHTLRETCPHHPEGCPKSCLCPKTHVEVGDTQTSHTHKHGVNPGVGVLVETAWTTCNDSGSADSAPVFATFVAEAGFVWTAPNATAKLRAQPGERPLDNVQAPPQKIPIV